MFTAWQVALFVFLALMIGGSVALLAFALMFMADEDRD